MIDADAFIKALPQPIAVVGNGAMKWKAQKINEYPTVIRFNDFADEGWEPHVGHRIDVWCVTCCGAVKYRTWKHPVSVMTIATRQEQPYDLQFWNARYPDMAIPNESWIEPARAIKQGNPTTGFTLMVRLLMHGIRFTGFGFDGCRTGHYWDRDHEHTPSHGDELPAIMELVRRGAVFG